MKRLCYIFLLLLYNPLIAQEKGHHAEVRNLKEVFTQGHVEGHIRNFFMSTFNEGDLKDYYTNAIGGAIAFKTEEYKGFELGVKGIFTYKGFSSDLNEPDETTGRVSKWEHELYDITDLENFNDLDRLEELYIKYYFKKGYFAYGKLAIEETLLLNESDGRMKPFAFKGFWLNLNKNKHVFNISWLDRVSPRSTVEWYDFNEAIGLVYNGYQPNGELANYHEKTNSKGLISLQYETEFDNLDVRANHYYLHHIFSTSLLELDFCMNNWFFGLQYAVQFPDGFQNNLLYQERYIQPNENGQVLSSKIGHKSEHWYLGISYTKSFDTGRFLFPRELGRDHFFTSISRSRLEGFGDANVFTLSGDYDFNIDRFQVAIEFTEVFGPETDNFKFNKYNLDEYYQINTRIHYELEGFFECLNFDLLYVFKENKNTDDAVNIFNRSNFHQINFVTNYIF